MKSMFLYNND